MEGSRVHDVIESLGFGWFHLRALFLGGGVWLADGAELLLIGSITRSLSKEWGLGGFERGAIVSVLFIGVLIGNVGSGTLGDKYGRRLPILLSYALIVAFSLMSACTWDVWSMTSARVLVGVAFGLGQPSWMAMSSEIVASNKRVLMSGLSMTMFVIGELYAALLIYEEDPKMKQLKWRWLLVLGCIPSVVFGISALFALSESPTWLALKGRISDARAVLDKMRQQNESDVPIDFQVQEQATEEEASFGAQLKVVCGRHLLFATVSTCFGCFTANFIFYGGLYAFPQVLPEFELNYSPAANLAFGALWEIPAYGFGILAAEKMTRKLMMQLYLVASVLSILCFLYGAGQLGQSQYSEWAILVGYFSMKFFVNAGFLVVYLFSAEIYPTSVRNTGSALCLAAGRLGSITCPLIYELFAWGTSSYVGFFYFTLGMCVVNLLLVSLLTIETAGKQLDAVEAETLKLVDSKAA